MAPGWISSSLDFRFCCRKPLDAHPGAQLTLWVPTCFRHAFIMSRTFSGCWLVYMHETYSQECSNQRSSADDSHPRYWVRAIPACLLIPTVRPRLEFMMIELCPGVPTQVTPDIMRPTFAVNKNCGGNMGCSWFTRPRLLFWTQRCLSHPEEAFPNQIPGCLHSIWSYWPQSPWTKW